MTTLLYEELAPITFSIGFLNCSFEKIQDAFIEWSKQNFKSIESKEMELPLLQSLEELQPLTAIPRKWLLVRTASDWVACFDNCTRGPDPVTVVCYLSQQLGCRGVVATSVPHTLSEDVGKKPGLYGAVQFELFAPHKTEFLNCERSVSLAYEAGKWRFDANGTVQSFEDTAAYTKRRVVDRFTPEMLKNYCHALGISVDSPEFYRGPALLVWANDPLPADWVTFSLSQVQTEMGLGSEDKR